MAATPSQALPISLVIVGLLTIVIALVYYYGSRKKHSWLAQCVTLVSWFFPFGIVFLLPLDLASTMYNNCTEATCREPWAYVSQEFLFIAWRTVYWSTFCLTWVIIPFLQSYLSAGGFTVKAKIWYAVRTNLYFYGVYLALGILGLVYIVAYKPFESRAALQGYIIAIANSWGLLLIIIFMGYGLVAIPRHFWNLSNIDLQLDRCYQNAPRLKEELMDAEVELDSLYKELSNVSRKVTTANPLRRHVNDMQREFLADKDFEGNRERRLFQENIPGIIDEKYLSELNRKLKKAVRITERHSALWQRLLNRAFYFQDIMKCRTESSRRFASSSTISTRFVRWQTTAERCAWWWHVRLRPLFLRATSVVCAIISLLLIWSEVTFNVKSPILSIVGISLRSIGQHYGIAELIAFVTLGYMSVCAYSSLLKVKVFNLYLLVPNHHTDELSMLWFGGYLCRLMAPLCYNFLNLAADQKSSGDTVFSTFMGKSDLVPFLGTAFVDWSPVLLLLPVAAAVFNLQKRIVRICGFDDYVADDDDDFITRPSDVEDGHAPSRSALNAELAEGRSIIQQERAAQERRPASSTRPSRTAIGNGDRNRTDGLDQLDHSLSPVQGDSRRPGSYSPSVADSEEELDLRGPSAQGTRHAVTDAYHDSSDEDDTFDDSAFLRLADRSRKDASERSEPGRRRGRRLGPVAQQNSSNISEAPSNPGRERSPSPNPFYRPPNHV